VVRQIDAEMSVRLKDECAREADPWQAFRLFCHSYLRLALEPETRRIVFRDAPAVLGQRFREIDGASALGPMVESLRALIETGRLRHADSEALARLPNGAMVDAALWIGGSNAPERTHALADAALDRLFDGLAAR
jgi:hypothetical protein